MDIGLMMGTTGCGFPTNRLAGSYTITVPGNILLNMAGYGFLAEMHGLQPAFNGLIMAIISVGHLCGQITGLGLNPGKIIVSIHRWLKRTDNLANNPRLRRQRAVAQLVASGMDDLKKYAAANQPDELFATLFRLLQEQLGERLDCPASAITENVIEE